MKSLFWNTVTPLVQGSLKLMISATIFEAFRLAGGTSLSLQLGHRMSLDIDLLADNIRLAAIEDIVAMKADVVQRGGKRISGTVQI